jgi:hypothetical protein
LIAACVRPQCPGSCCCRRVRWSVAWPTRSHPHPFGPRQPRNDWNPAPRRKTRAIQARHERRRAWRKTGQEGGVAQARTSASERKAVACAIVTVVPCEVTRTAAAQRASPTPANRPCRACFVVLLCPSVVGRCLGRPNSPAASGLLSTAGQAAAPRDCHRAQRQHTKEGHTETGKGEEEQEYTRG